MSQTITITYNDIIEQAKLSWKINDLIEGIINRRIVIATATELGIQVNSEDIQKSADQFRFINNLHSARDTWAYLERYNQSLENFEELIYANLIGEKVFDNLFADKIEAYFFEHQLDYAKAVIYELFMDDDELVMELFYAIQEGEISFYDAAHQYINDIELRRRCGYRGIVNRTDLKPEISAAVFAAQPPQLLKPIVTSKGVHLILVEEIVQPELNEELRQKIGSDLFSEWLRQKNQEIEVINKFE